MPKTASTTVTFGQPPQPRGGRYDWATIASELRSRPGEWALVFEDDKTTLVTAIRNRGIKALRPEKGFEVRTVNNTREYPRTCDLWMRYVPEKDEEN